MLQEHSARFQSSFTYDLSVKKEVTRWYSLFHPRFYMIRGLVVVVILFFIFYLYVLQRDYDFYSKYYFILIAVYWGIQGLTALLNRDGGTQYKRILSNNKGQPLRNDLTFDNEGIHCFNPDTGNRLDYRYTQIRSIAQTKHYMILLMEYNQHLIVNKSNLTGGGPDEFINYLLSLCPKIKPRKLRSNRPGLIMNIIVITVWVLGLILAIFRMPLVQELMAHNRPINDSMSYQQIAVELEQFGIGIEDEVVEELEQFYVEYPYYAEFSADYSKVTDLLCYAGWGTYDTETLEWTPSTSGVYWFDTEVMDVSTMYTDFLRGVSALDSEALNFTNIQEDTSGVDLEYDSGIQAATFDWNGNSYRLEGTFQYDWFDLQAADDMNTIIGTQGGDKQLYFSYDGGQGILVFYCTDQWAREFESATGIDLCDKTASLRGYWY